MMPDNFLPADRTNPYAGYGVNRLYDFVKRRGVVKPKDTLYRYSNVGVGLLGQALAERARKGYPVLLRDAIAEPLGVERHGGDYSLPTSGSASCRAMTIITRRCTSGPWMPWPGRGDPLHCAGHAGCLEANLHPERYPALTGAIRATQRVREDARGDTDWFGLELRPGDRHARHGGTTGGFTSHAFFVPRCECAVVVLMNSGPNAVFNPDLIGEHVRARSPASRR